MSVQFGRWNLDGQAVDPEYISRVRALLAPYAPDAMTVCVKGAFFILHGAFHTTNEARREHQPSISPAGTYLTWTGRLDNQSELLSRLNASCSPDSTDLEIVSSLYELEGRESLVHFIGDWSLSVLHHHERTLLLSVDFLGARPLYYLRGDRYVSWSSALDPLVLLASDKFTLSEEYVAGWLDGFPAAELTPYCEIRAVPPGTSVEFTRNALRIRQYWRFRPQQMAQCATDAEYEEGFRHFFRQAVRRRLRSCGPVVSELSGGMDSSSIVCVADQILESDADLTPRLDTLSYLNDSEPDWNERPFVKVVEDARGRAGLHVNVDNRLDFIPTRDRAFFPSTPASGILPSLPQQQVSEYLTAANIRVVLSGLGGDETTGGLPDGSAELADLFVEARLATFLRRAVAWCLPTRRPLIQIVASVLTDFLPLGLIRPSLLRKQVPWITQELEHIAIMNPAYARLRLKISGLRPSIQENLYTLEDLRRQVASAPHAVAPPRERRYPFFDRDFLEFLYNVPRAQIVRPGRRRSLMRRALLGIVPEALLERKRKAVVARAGLKSLSAQAEAVTAWTKNMVCSELGAIDIDCFHRVLVAACSGDNSHLWRLSRTFALESWLRDERVQAILQLPANRLRSHCRGTATAVYSLGARQGPQLGKPEQKGGESNEIRKAGNSLCG
jgi:asparagine synthase (glutamine-hydrolysing)